MKLKFLFVLCITLIFGCSTQSFASSPLSLCKAPEKTYFTCQTTNHKVLSLCGVLPGTLQYRFGTPKKVELAFPKSPKDGPKIMRYAYYFRYRTSYAQIVFDSADDTSKNQSSTPDYAYTIFDEYEDDGISRDDQGVTVVGQDNVEHTLLCKSPAKGDLATPGQVLKCDPDNALNDSSDPNSCHR